MVGFDLQRGVWSPKPKSVQKVLNVPMGGGVTGWGLSPKKYQFFAPFPNPYSEEEDFYQKKYSKKSLSDSEPLSV